MRAGRTSPCRASSSRCCSAWVSLSQGVYGGGAAAEPLPPLQLLDGYGRLVAPPPTALPATPNDLAHQCGGPPSSPRLLRQVDGAARPSNLGAALPKLAPLEGLAPDVQNDPFAVADTVDLMPWLLGAAFALLLADMIIALALRGLLSGWRRPGGRAVAGLAFLLLLLPAVSAGARDGLPINSPSMPPAPRGSPMSSPAMTRATASASRASFGLSLVIAQRTAAELGDPIGVNLETDELAFFPVLYWRVPGDEAPLSATAEQRLSDYLKHGGMVLFDTADQLGALAAAAPRRCARAACATWMCRRWCRRRPTMS